MEGNSESGYAIQARSPLRRGEFISFEVPLNLHLVAVSDGVTDGIDQVQTLSPYVVLVLVVPLDNLPGADAQILEILGDRLRSRVLPVESPTVAERHADDILQCERHQSHLVQQVIDALLVEIPAVPLKLRRQCDIQHAELRRRRTSVTRHLLRKLLEPYPSLNIPDPQGPKFPHAEHRTRIRRAGISTSPVD